jgi:hypothetical protein
MAQDPPLSTALLFMPGDVLALLTPLQELDPGLYVVHAMTDDWAVLRWLIDDEQAEKIFVTEREARLPAPLLKLFMPIGLTLSSLA